MFLALCTLLLYQVELGQTHLGQLLVLGPHKVGKLFQVSFLELEEEGFAASVVVAKFFDKLRDLVLLGTE